MYGRCLLKGSRLMSGRFKSTTISHVYNNTFYVMIREVTYIHHPEHGSQREIPLLEESLLHQIYACHSQTVVSGQDQARGTSRLQPHALPDMCGLALCPNKTNKHTITQTHEQNSLERATINELLIPARLTQNQCRGSYSHLRHIRAAI